MFFSITASLVMLKKVFLFFLVSYVVVLSSSYCSANDTLKLTFSYQINESYPYQMGTGTEVANPPGIAIDIIKTAAEIVSIDIEFVRYPNKRVQLYLREGIIDGAFMFSFKKERMANGRYPLKDGKLDTDRSITTLNYSLYTLKGSSIKWDGETISGLPIGEIGAGRGNSIVGYLQKLGVRVKEYNIENDAFVQLNRDRLDAVAAQDTTADPLIIEKGFTNIKKSDKPLQIKPYFLMLSTQFVEKYPVIAEQLWNAIEQVREQVVQEVSSQYIK